jgi:Sec-independent protein translocase protein TatA
MNSGVSFSEILVILTLIIIFVKPKDIPELLRKTMKIARKSRGQLRKFMDEITKM